MPAPTFKGRTKRQWVQHRNWCLFLIRGFKGSLSHFIDWEYFKNYPRVRKDIAFILATLNNLEVEVIKYYDTIVYMLEHSPDSTSKWKK